MRLQFTSMPKMANVSCGSKADLYKNSLNDRFWLLPVVHKGIFDSRYGCLLI